MSDLPFSTAVGSVRIPLTSAGGGVIHIDVATSTAFRLGVGFNGASPTAAIVSPSVAADSSAAPSTTVSWGGMSGLSSSFGALLAGSDGSWALYDHHNNSLAHSTSPITSNGAAISAPSSGARGAAQPCLSNGNFGPPFFHDAANEFLVYAVSGVDHDVEKIHCYPAGFAGAVPSGPRPPTPKGDTCTTKRKSTDAGDYVHSSGTNSLTTHDITKCCTACNDNADCTAWIWADEPDGSGFDCWLMSRIGSTHARSNRTVGGVLPPAPSPGPAPGPGSTTTYWALGDRADFYFAPTATAYAFVDALWGISGSPKVPPRHGLAFMATYWGYKNMSQVEGYMNDFRSKRYPIDSFIMDYDWWNTKNDTEAPSGRVNDSDFGYAASFWTRNKFRNGKMYAGAKATLDHFHEDLNMRFGGIRKPRTYSNIKLSNTSGWMLSDKDGVGAGNNNWNMSHDAGVGTIKWSDWYIANHEHFLRDGIDYWWNDEGETQWFTYQWWNEAQAKLQQKVKPNSRHFTINRAFTPGMQTFPAVTWSGDRQDCAHSVMLSFADWGQTYSACDMTSPDATVLLRQYQYAALFPVMRAHQMHGVPRFPFLWSEATHGVAFRHALELRYHLLPYIYSLAHDARRRHRPIARRASYEFPHDPKASTQYMLGNALLVGDIGAIENDGGKKTGAENASSVYLPTLESSSTSSTSSSAAVCWYPFNSTTGCVVGGKTLTKTLALDEIVMYVRPGTVLTMQRDVVQFSDAIGGVLAVHVYAGADGTFDLVEDDGETLDYAAVGGEAHATRTTTFTWRDASRTLSWSRAGAFAGDARSFVAIDAVLLEAGRPYPVKHESAALSGSPGKIVFPATTK